MKYIIIVDKQPKTNPSDEKKQYEIDIEELRVKGDIYDSIVITKNEDYVMRRLSLSEFHVLSVLDEPVKEPLTELNIELFEGNNYIYLLDEIGNKIYAEYLIKNDFNDIYVTNNQMNSAINQNAQQIELTVNQKLTSYATNEEVENNMIELNSKIIQTATEITSEVSKKVGNDEIISKINQSAEQVGIDANKIELSANDVLNLLAGNTINLTSKNIIISSDKFSVDKNGKVTCSDINITSGNIVLSGTKDNPDFKVQNNNYNTLVCSDGIYTNSNLSTSAHSYIYTDNEGGGITLGGNTANDIILKAGNSSKITCYGNIYANAYNYNSKEELKKNISKLNINVLEIVKNADVYEFNYKTEENIVRKHIGFIIGKNYNTPAEIINEEKNGIDAYSMCSILWKAMQELIEENNKLKQRIEKIENKEVK